MFTTITPILFFVAFLLLFLVTLSIPIIKTIFLFKLSADVASGLLDSEANGSAYFGIWGYCLSSVDVSIFGIDHTMAATCSAKHFGYTIDNTVASALHATNVQNVISRATTAALVLHPIAAGFTFLAFLISLSLLHRNKDGPSRSMPSVCTLTIGLLAATLASIVFLIDIIFVAVAKHKVGDVSDGSLRLNWGNAVWMMLAATISMWLGVVSASVGVCACRRRSFFRRKEHISE